MFGRGVESGVKRAKRLWTCLKGDEGQHRQHTPHKIDSPPFLHTHHTPTPTTPHTFSPPCCAQRLRREMKDKIDQAVEDRVIQALLGDTVDSSTEASFRYLYK